MLQTMTMVLDICTNHPSSSSNNTYGKYVESVIMFTLSISQCITAVKNATFPTKFYPHSSCALTVFLVFKDSTHYMYLFFL